MTSTSATSIRVGSYQLGRQLGEGGSAEVFAATAPDGRDVAVKLLGPHAELDDERARARFDREIELVGAIDHPNLVRLIDSGFDDELGPFLVTEIADGANLRQHLGLGPDLAALFALPLARALDALHGAGLVHRDIKPENAIVTRDGRVIVIDLGLAFRPGQTRFTGEGEVTGSLPYMSPEQIEGREIGSASDVWALGVVVYELTCGKRPFERERPSEEAAAILVGAAPALEKRDERVSPQLADLVRRCLSADPNARPSASEAITTLGSVIDWVAESDEARGRALDERERQLGVIRAHRVAALREAARVSTSRFEAVAQLSRALAYDPEDPETRAAISAVADVDQPAPATSKPIVATPNAGRRRRLGTLVIGGAIALLAAVAVALAFVPNDSELALLEGIASRAAAATPAEPPTVLGHIKDSLIGDIPERSRSDVAAKRVAGGMIEIFGRALGAERDADGTLVARQGGAGEKSNEELTLDVFGGMLDLIEDGVAARRGEPPTAVPTGAAGSTAASAGDRTMTIDAPKNLSDDDKPRSLALIRKRRGEPLLVVAGRKRAELKVIASEIGRQRQTSPDNASLKVAHAIYLLAGVDEKAGLALLADVRTSAPEVAMLHFVDAKIAMRRGKPKEALAAIARGLRIEPGSDDGLALRGRVRFVLGQTKSAFADFGAALSKDDRNVGALAGLAELLHAVSAPTSLAPVVRQLQLLTLDDKRGRNAVHHLGTLCETGIESACP